MESNIDSVLANALNEQMNKEIAAMLWYGQMRARQRKVWRGSHKFMHAHETGEQKDARKFDHYLSDRGFIPTYTAQPAPTAPDGTQLLEALQAALDLENANLEALNTLYYLAEKREDPATCEMLDDLIKDEIDDIADIARWVTYTQRAGGDASALIMIDDKLYKAFA
jgi:ferritin